MKLATDITDERENLASGEGLMAGVNATMATIEFLPNGEILKANENFLQLMQYDLSEIQGQHHRMFVDPEEANSEAYANFWTGLASGESSTGVFYRRTSEGRKVILNAIYSPIRDASGKVVKVMKMATDITKERENMMAGEDLISGVNATMATIEFCPKGYIMKANENFLKLMQYDLSEIEGQHHRLFVDPSEANTESYASFWKCLALGKPANGTFHRITANGNQVQLNAVYTPIRDAGGRVVKIMKLATELAQNPGLSAVG